MGKLSKRHFWEWFKRNQAEYVALPNKTKKETAYWLDELTAHLRAYARALDFTLESKKQEMILTITVNGRAAHFNKADTFVARAPEIDGWKFVSLEDPRPIDFAMEKQIAQTGIDPRELSFSFASDSPRGIGLMVYHSLCTPQNEHRLYALAIAAVYNLLGERSYGADISWLQVENLSSADGNDLNKLEELPACIDLRRSEMVVDGEGKLVGIS